MRAPEQTLPGDRDALILVDEADRERGYLSKLACHRSPGVLHRAFSILLFNERGELLLQQRSAAKRLWPLYWSNSCCSHPRRSESLQSATQRRLREELGIEAPLTFLFKFRYQAQFDAQGAEHELCSVYVGRCGHTIRPDPDEIHDVRWIAPSALEAEMAQPGDLKFTPWFLLEWERLWRDHRSAVHAL